MKSARDALPVTPKQVNNVLIKLFEHYDRVSVFELIAEAATVFSDDLEEHMDHLKRKDEFTISDVSATIVGESSSWLLTGIAMGIALSKHENKITNY